MFVFHFQTEVAQTELSQNEITCEYIHYYYYYYFVVVIDVVVIVGVRLLIAR